MKDLPHHAKQLNKKVLRSLKHEEEEVEEFESHFRKEESIKQEKKKAKLAKKQRDKSHTPHVQTVEERNKEMKNRPPIKREGSHHPRPAK